MPPDPADMQAIAERERTVADQIRALDRAGYKRADIARFLGKRYQHVRNVLVADQQTRQSRAGAGEEARPNAEPDQAEAAPSLKVRVGPGGQVIIPAQFREALAIRDGEILFARIEDGELRLLTPAAAMRRAQAIVRQFVPEGVSLVDELIEGRRREAEREAERG